MVIVVSVCVTDGLVIQLQLKKSVKMRCLIAAQMPLSELHPEFEGLRQKGGKILFVFFASVVLSMGLSR